MCDLKSKPCLNDSCGSYNTTDPTGYNCLESSGLIVEHCPKYQPEAPPVKSCGDCRVKYKAHVGVCRTCKWNPINNNLSDHHTLKKKLYYQILIKKEFADEEDFRLSSKRNRNVTHSELDAMCDSVLFSSNDDFSAELVEIENGVLKKLEE